MKCPKCGYNSFDYLDSCKKCGKDLTEHKQRFGIVSVLFPGQMKPHGSVAPMEEDSSLDVAVAAASAVAASTLGPASADAHDEEEFAATEPVTGEVAEGADFGFDFMGDSEEEEDLSFDELFEEAPSDEDVEESLPSPAQAASDEFAFDLDDTEAGAGDDELESDFGFDPDAANEEEAADDFSFDPNAIDFEDDEDQGAEEDPKDPFDLPEPVAHEQAPVTIDYLAPQQDTDVDPVVALAVVESADFAFGAAAAELEREDLLPSALELPVPASEFGAAAGEELAPESVVSFADLQSKAAAIADEPDFSAQGELLVPDAAGSSVDLLLPATGSRVLAFVCDLLLLVLVGTSFVIAAEAAISPSAGLLPSAESMIDLSIPYFLVLFSLAFGYFTLFHFLAGQTPGKMLAGLRVEALNGEALLFSQAFLRSVGGLLQLLPIGLGYLAILFSPERRGWNDQLAGTRLISLKGLPHEA